MNLPPDLASAIASATEGIPTSALTHAATELSDAYRARRPIGQTYMTSDAHRLAYAATRLPATYAAVHASLGYTAEILSDYPIESCLDLGAGPGTAAWAATQIWPSIGQITLIEQDADLITLGKQFAQDGPSSLQSADWQRGDLTSLAPLPEHDLVICSYAVGELRPEAVTKLINTAWSITRGILAIIEPGTVPGFAHIRAIRDQLIALDAHVVAPCPHQDACPMSETDWCHFAQRLDRSSLHRQLKSGDLGHEDEKFSYISVSKNPINRPDARVLRHPQRRSGHAHIQICTGDGIRDQTLTRSQKADWKRIRRLDWGDVW